MCTLNFLGLLLCLHGAGSRVSLWVPHLTDSTTTQATMAQTSTKTHWRAGSTCQSGWVGILYVVCACVCIFMTKWYICHLKYFNISLLCAVISTVDDVCSVDVSTLPVDSVATSSSPSDYSTGVSNRLATLERRLKALEHVSLGCRIEHVSLL